MTALRLLRERGFVTELETGLNHPTDSALHRAAWRYYWKLYAGMRGRILLALLSALGQSAALLPVPLLIGYLLDKAIAAGDPRVVLLVGAVVFAAHLIYSGLVLTTRHQLLVADSNAIKTLRQDLVDKLLNTSRGLYTRLDRSRTQTAIVHDTERVAAMSGALIDQFLPGLIAAAALITMMIWIYARLALVTLTFVPVLYYVLHVLSRRMRRESRSFRSAFEDFSRGVSRLLQELPLIENTGARSHTRERESVLIERLRRSTRDFNMSVTKYDVMQNLLVGVSGALVLVVGGAGIVGGHITPGQLLSLYAGFSLLRNQWLTVSRAVPRIITGIQSLVALCETLRVSDPPPYHGTERLSFAGSVTLEGVFFRYTDGLILKGANMRIERGAHVALVGENGAGKSTVVNLILGLYRPERGRILVDGRELRDLDLPHLRRQIGVVPQDPIIVLGTIADNIAYGAPEVGEREIERAARLSGAHEFIKSLPRGYETQVGEDGMLLSGGQRQRIALARALVRRPRLLILDEPTNHLEAASFDALVRNLRGLDERPTMLVISHSTDVVRSAEFVYVLHEGSITAGSARVLASAKELPVG